MADGTNVLMGEALGGDGLEWRFMPPRWESTLASAFEASDSSTGVVQFEIRGRNGPIDPGSLTWKMLSSEGSFNERTGIYTEPGSSVPGSSIAIESIRRTD
ncbi:hypothetical protein D3C84_987720 [compost metagenome]